MAPKFFEKLADSLLKRGAKELLDRIMRKKKDEPSSNPTPSSPPSPEPAPEPKAHPWRICPIGEHWVRPHPLTVPVSNKNPDGVTTRNTGCRKNPVRGKKKTPIQDYLHPHEIQEIAKTYFKGLTGSPASGAFPEFPGSDQYDDLIRGWVKYWNEVLQPETPLDPDLIKALIASESGFNLKPKEQDAGAAGKTHGMAQLTDQTIKALQNPDGELKNHLVSISKEEASDPNIAICAATRWLFYKRERASARLKRGATWVEGVAEYKGYLKDMVSGKDPDPKGMQNIQGHYARLKK